MSMIRAYINATTKAVTRAVLPGFATMVMKWLRDFKTLVLADSGTVEDEARTAQILRVIENHNLMDDLKLAVFSDGGIKTRTSGTDTFVVKTYDLTVNDNDPAQSVEVNQPYLKGNIAPTEVQTYKCVTGQTKTLTHTGVVVNGTYTVIKVLNAENSGKTVVSFTEVTTGTLDTIAWTGRLYFYAIYGGTIDSGEQTEIRNAILGIIPEIEGVTIGVQHWATSNLEMVATPMGTVIPEVTDVAVWASSPTLYSDAYTAATGTEAEKVYAGLKAAAMWCYYNNDPVRGATYGKLYNWYAVKLLQTDIDAYNAANPTTPWGWKVSTDADFETLRTTVASLGWNYDGTTILGSAIANKQGKALASDSLWTASANGGAVGNTDYPDKRNISGFTGLPGGFRYRNGVFYDIGSLGYCWSSTESSASNAWYRNLTYNSTNVYRNSFGKEGGFSVRLLKS